MPPQPEPRRKGTAKKKVLDTSQEILTTAEAAAFLRVDTTTLRKMVADDAIPFRRVGRNFRFSRSALLAWLAEQGSAD